MYLVCNSDPKYSGRRMIHNHVQQMGSDKKGEKSENVKHLHISK